MQSITPSSAAVAVISASAAGKQNSAKIKALRAEGQKKLKRHKQRQLCRLTPF